jgi:hypothetical protein
VMRAVMGAGRRWEQEDDDEPWTIGNMGGHKCCLATKRQIPGQ